MQAELPFASMTTILAKRLLLELVNKEMPDLAKVRNGSIADMRARSFMHAVLTGLYSEARLILLLCFGTSLSGDAKQFSIYFYSAPLAGRFFSSDG